MQSASAAWYRAETTNFIVYMDESERAVSELADTLEQFDQVLRIMTGATAEPSPVKVRVFAVRTEEGVRGLLGGNSRGVAGFYVGQARGSYMVVPEELSGTGGRVEIGTRIRHAAQGFTGNEVLFHEYTHHFMLHYFPAGYPAWYREGFAELMSTTRFEGDRVVVGAPLTGRAYTLIQGSWPRIADVLSNEEVPAEALYALGWLITHYTAFNEEAREDLGAYLQAIQEGRTAEQAYEASFGASEQNYDRTLRRYINDGIPVLDIAKNRLTSVDADIERLDDGQAKIALLFPRQGDDGLVAAEAAAAQFPQSAQVQVEIARLRLATDDMEGALAAADRALQLDPELLEANLYKGRVLARMALDGGDPSDPHWAEARGFIARANRADPDNALALYSYYEAFPNDSERSDLVDNALAVAYSLAPQDQEVRVTYADEKINQHHPDQALLLLNPLIGSHSEIDPELMATITSLRASATEGEGVTDEE